MQTYLFDDRNVTWQTIGSVGAQIHVLAVDDVRGIADVLIRFQPNTPGKLHQHVCEFRYSRVAGGIAVLASGWLFEGSTPDR